MCGIVGAIRIADGDVVRRMTRLLAHRGPDDEGFWQDGDVVFGHRRLSILDLSPAGHQPMQTDDGELTIVFNGEIYDFPRVREELELLGHRFRTHSDTEVLLLGYRQWGDAMLERIEGIFAFGLWDAAAGRLLLARDRSGVKPLYWHSRDGGLAFASELKPFRLLPDFVSAVSRRALRSTMRFACNLEEESMLAGVHKLPPGKKLIWQDGRVQVSSYWSYPEPRARAWSPNDAARTLRDVLGRTVRAQMISDAPLGAALSGGLDSSGVVALMAEQGAKVRTYTVGHGHDDPDLIAARVVAEHCRTDHHEIMIESEDVLDLLPRVMWFLEEPLGQMEIVQMHLNYEAASKHVKVLLVGEGADELFAGYDRYRIFDRARPLTPGLRAALYERVYMYADRQPRHLLGALASRVAFGHLAGSPMKDPLPRAAEPPLRGLPRERALERALNHDQRTYLPELSLKRADATGMAHGLELRVPFLGREVVELAATFPGDLHRKGGVEKWLLREALRPLLPQRIVERRKHGFQMRLDQRLVDTLQAMCDRLMPDDKVAARGFFDPRRVRALRDGRPRAGAPFIAHRVWSFRIWAMLMAEVWARLFLDTPPGAPPPAHLADIA
ncbi:MAG: asparagine synthase (glutamine-hydrolyzing) [Planctomycetes bacterium]|nr:asparagine synthase (glutamine-hydrolyzing) [Planctomycetota bacterium]